MNLLGFKKNEKKLSYPSKNPFDVTGLEKGKKDSWVNISGGRLHPDLKGYNFIAIKKEGQKDGSPEHYYIGYDFNPQETSSGADQKKIQKFIEEIGTDNDFLDGTIMLDRICKVADKIYPKEGGIKRKAFDMKEEDI